MKRLLFAIIALMAVVNVKGAGVLDALTGVTEAKLEYLSVDAQNREITLSAKLYYKKSNVNFMLINCHPTITHDAGCPTGDAPLLDPIKYMVSEGAVVICPDYLGFGKTADKTHPYMCATLTGRNVLDAYKAAIIHIKDDGVTIPSNYYTINVGYSQGGATALAFQRYLETQATDADRQLVNLRGSVCGAGPYDQNIVFDVYENKDGKGFATLDYPIYLLYVLQGHKQAFGESTMRKLELEECFTPEFWAACQGENGFLNLLNKKETNVDNLNKAVKDAGFKTFYSIINEAYKDHKSKVYRTIRKTLEQSNLLAGTADDWTPKTPIIFYHDKRGNDIVVPYACTEAALARFTGHCTYVDAIDHYGYDCLEEKTGIFGSKYTVANKDIENYLWHAAVFRVYWDDMWLYTGQNFVMGVAVFSGNESYDFNQLDHRTFGARFYAQFLGMRKNLRHEKLYPNFDGIGKGTASTTSIPFVAPSSYSIPGTAASTAGTYDRIEMALPTKMQEGKLTFLQFPATVDGYYFGAEAKRYEVTLDGEGKVTEYTPMDDGADFEPGTIYLVETPYNDDVINIVTAAKKKDAFACDLKWRERNMRKTNTVTGKSYVSNYMPFAYTTPEGAAAYTMEVEPVSDDGTEGYLQAVEVEGVVPAGTGTIIVYSPEITGNTTPDSNPVIVLEPYVESTEFEPLAQNKLTGSYTEIPNKENYLHFGLNNGGQVGFWAYPQLTTVAPYSAFINMDDAQAKVFYIDFDNDATGITTVNSNRNDDRLYNIAGQRVNENAKGIIIKNGKKYLVK